MPGSLSYIKQYYKMPWLKRGMEVLAQGKKGYVTSGGSHVRVRLEGERYSRPYHPQWGMVYFDKSSEILADYR